MITSIYKAAHLVLGCGNPLFGDDGFAAAVIRGLEAGPALPGDVACLDAGTAVRDILFDFLLSEEKPRRIIIVDAMSLDDAPPGEIREIGLDDIRADKICDYSLHQFPTTNLLMEIHQLTPIEVRVLVVNPGEIPPEVRPGLSDKVARAVPEMCRMIRALLDSTPAPNSREVRHRKEYSPGHLNCGTGPVPTTVHHTSKKKRSSCQQYPSDR